MVTSTLLIFVTTTTGVGELSGGGVPVVLSVLSVLSLVPFEVVSEVGKVVGSEVGEGLSVVPPVVGGPGVGVGVGVGVGEVWGDGDGDGEGFGVVWRTSR